MKNFLKYIVVFIACVLCSFNISAQDQWTMESEFSVEIDDFYVDGLSNVYLLHDNVITKVKKNGDTLFRFSDMSIGNISNVDVSNMLRPVIFCQQNSEIIITDNTLTMQNGIHNLSDLDLYNASLVASSKIDNGIWIYDNELFQLVKVNTSFERIYESGNLEQLLLKENLAPIQLKEFDSKVYMLSPENGILVFDIYGSYINTIPLLGVEWMQIIETGILYLKDGEYYKYDALNFESYQVDLPMTDFKKIAVVRNEMFIWTGEKIILFKL